MFRGFIFDLILEAKSKLIKSKTLWLDLYLFQLYLAEIEDTLGIISYSNYKTTKVRSIVNNCTNIGEILEKAASDIRVKIGVFVVSPKEIPNLESYESFFTVEIRSQMEKYTKAISDVMSLRKIHEKEP